MVLIPMYLSNVFSFAVFWELICNANTNGDEKPTPQTNKIQTYILYRKQPPASPFFLYVPIHPS